MIRNLENVIREENLGKIFVLHRLRRKYSRRGLGRSQAQRNIEIQLLPRNKYRKKKRILMLHLHGINYCIVSILLGNELQLDRFWTANYAHFDYESQIQIVVGSRSRNYAQINLEQDFLKLGSWAQLR
ncbi:hypothetical protein AVEN_165921-1 [Araneus ventricosus]|uniref:Uncharacterized protein n=1 Tax=Araneus ventricosus TaxID=182803 RepID=A0A4Y2WZ48_ARAVE|nr:hypothetical protein AVEN_165921-1 [Araneus ventricosus]